MRMTPPNATYLGVGVALVVSFLALPTHAGNPPPLVTDRGAVATDDARASEVGARVLARGGNAADAAAAAALALGVVNPSSSGIGGGGFAVVYVAREKKTYVLDFRELAPARLTPSRFVRHGKIDPHLSRSGGLAVGVPGEIAGLEQIVSRFGRRSWRDAVMPAQHLAHHGFRVSRFLARATRAAGGAVNPRTPLGRWLRRDGSLIRAGLWRKRPALARTLSLIAKRGRAGFYQGAVARDIIARVKATGGVMTLKDLRDYRVVERTPLTGSWAGKRIATMPLPSSGGIVLLEALGILAATGQDLAKHGAGSWQAYHLTVEALKHAFADRSRFLGDSASAKAVGARLLDPARLVRLGKRVKLGGVQPLASYGDKALGPATAPPARGGGTSHLCVIDAEGNAVALTTTVNGYFGADLMTRRTGIVLNNEMDDFSLRAGAVNMFGLVQSKQNLVGPGKRPLSSMTPTLVFKGDKVVGCMGGSGGPQIISNTLQVLLNVFTYGMSATRALAAPRFHHQWKPDRLSIDRKVPRSVRAQLVRRGHSVHARRPGTYAVQLVVVRADGKLEAASDPRKGGRPADEARFRKKKRTRKRTR